MLQRNPSITRSVYDEMIALSQGTMHPGITSGKQQVYVTHTPLPISGVTFHGIFLS